MTRALHFSGWIQRLLRKYSTGRGYALGSSAWQYRLPPASRPSWRFQISVLAPVTLTIANDIRMISHLYQRRELIVSPPVPGSLIRGVEPRESRTVATKNTVRTARERALTLHPDRQVRDRNSRHTLRHLTTTQDTIETRSRAREFVVRDRVQTATTRERFRASTLTLHDRERRIDSLQSFAERTAFAVREIASLVAFRESLTAVHTVQQVQLQLSQLVVSRYSQFAQALTVERNSQFATLLSRATSDSEMLTATQHFKHSRNSHTYAVTATQAPARELQVNNEKILIQAEQRATEIVKREFQTFASTRATAVKLTRDDLADIASRVESHLTRRLSIERERKGVQL